MTQNEEEINMKKFTPLTLITLLALSPLAVVNADQHVDKAQMSMGMMDEAKIEKMQTHMSEMNTVLEKVKKETDPQKRQEMLQQHVNNMKSMMAMMHASEMGKGQSMGKHKMDKMKKGDAAMPTEQKMEMMEKRLEMMEQMMEQMIGHTAEKSKMLHKHK
jgi:protein CpxP